MSKTKKRPQATAEDSGNLAASFKYEVILWAVLALSVILFISNFGIAGRAGNFISSIFFGLFGLTAYIFPLLLFAGTAFLISNKDNKVAVMKAGAALVFFLFVCMFLELTGGDGQAESPLDSYLWAVEHKYGGGLAGGLLAWLVRPNFGIISAYVIDIAMLIISMVLITQRSLWKHVQSGSRKMYVSAKNETIRQRQQYTERRQRRIDNKVAGVSTDTSIKNTAKPGNSDNVNEIRPDPAFIQDFPIHMMGQPPRQAEEAADLWRGQAEGRADAWQDKAGGRADAWQSQVEGQANAWQSQAEGRADIRTGQAVGTDYDGIMPFPVNVGSAQEPWQDQDTGTAYLDNIIPIKNKKVVLQPNPTEGESSGEPDANLGTGLNEEMQGMSAAEEADNILLRTSELFSELLPAGDVASREDSELLPARDAASQEDLNVGFKDDMLQSSKAADNWDVAEGTAGQGMSDSAVGDGKLSAGNATGQKLSAAATASGQLDMPDRDAAAPNAGYQKEGTVNPATGYGNSSTHNLAAEQTPEYGQEPGYGDSSTHNLATEQTPEYGQEPGYGDSSTHNLAAEQTPEYGQEPGYGASAASAEDLIAQQLQSAKTAPVKATSSASRPAPEPVAQKPAAAQPLHNNPKQSEAEIASGVADIGVQLHNAKPVVKREYILPPVRLLNQGDPNKTGDSRQHLQETALKLQQTLKNFGVNVTILNVSCGPSVTRYEIQPEMGVKVSKIVNLADDIKLNLAAADIRIEAPIPGKAAIGIEVPNKENIPVMFRDLIESEQFRQQASPCTFAAGKDIAGQVVVTDICKMPHLLIAGATGSGKSVCINTIIMSIIYKADPEDVKLIMIDPKVVELSVYNGIPHLLLPVVTDPKKAAGALHWAVAEMMDRYQKFADCGVRDMKGYNAKIKKIENIPEDNKPQKMPYIVIIVDELADLMMAAPGDVEDAICRLAQLARAAGIHLIIATQRPSVNVITGLIKANMPSRIAFSVTSGIDSRTILDMNGAEKLLGKGDMLFYPQGYQKPVRVQGAFVSDSEVSEVVEFLTTQNGTPQYSSAIEEQVANAASGSGGASADSAQADERDVYFADAAKLLIDKDKASVSMLQRYFKIGFNRAARIMAQLEEAGVVGPEEGTKPRKILMGPEEFAQYEEEVL